jgi:hypothetical protein
MKQPLTTFVTRANYPESDAFPVLAGDVEVHKDLDSVIFVFDKGYAHYGRFAGMKNDGVDFVTPFKNNAKHEVVDESTTSHTNSPTVKRYELLTNTSSWEPWDVNIGKSSSCTKMMTTKSTSQRCLQTSSMPWKSH